MSFTFENILPYAFALIIAIPFLVLLRQFVYTYISLKEKELSSLSQGNAVTSRAQAYERITLFLERSKPANLISRFDDSIAAHEFIFLASKTIEQEFDYNASQQLYLSKKVWNEVSQAKAKLINLLQKTYESMNQKPTLQEYKTVFLMAYIQEGDFINQTLEDLKVEFLKTSFTN